MLRIKRGPYGARLHGLNPAMVLAAQIVDEWMNHYDLDYELTSGIEGQHMTASLHYVGYALDFTVRNHEPSQSIEDMALRVTDNLGDEFDVELNSEKMRLHVEFQPKTSYGKLG